MIAAMAGILVASCGREDITPGAYDSFYLYGPNLCNTSKMVFDNQGLWWTAGDHIFVNGKDHEVLTDGEGNWRTHGTQVSSHNGKFYVGIPLDPIAHWDEINCLYGPYNFTSGDIVPLAIASSTNRLTLWPCCAVIRSTQYDYAYITVTNGKIATYGYIQPGETLAQCNITLGGDGTDLDNGDWFAIGGSDGAYYFVLPIVDDEVEAILDFGSEVTPNPVVLKKGYFYDLN